VERERAERESLGQVRGLQLYERERQNYLIWVFIIRRWYRLLGERMFVTTIAERTLIPLLGRSDHYGSDQHSAESDPLPQTDKTK
jgi:hypothetical protein